MFQRTLNYIYSERKKYRKNNRNRLQLYIAHDLKIKRIAVAAPVFLKKTWMPPLAREYTSDRSRLPKWHFLKSIWSAFQWSNPFPPEWVIGFPGQYKYFFENRISKMENIRFLHDFEICQNQSRNNIFFFAKLLVSSILQHFKSSLMKLCMQLPNNIR